MTTHTWNGHTIEITSHLEARVLWLGLGFSVKIDGEATFKSPRKFEGLRTTVPFQLNDAGIISHGRVESGRVRMFASTPYRVTADDQEIATGEVFPGNWYMFWVTASIVWGLTACIMYFR
jgi:hypothetical protein